MRNTQAQHYDGNISIPGCDKNMPGCFIAAVRHNRPTIIVYGGTIQAGVRHTGMSWIGFICWSFWLVVRVTLDCSAMGKKKGETVNISDAFESYGESIHLNQIVTPHILIPFWFRCLRHWKHNWRAAIWCCSSRLPRCWRMWRNVYRKHYELGPGDYWNILAVFVQYTSHVSWSVIDRLLIKPKYVMGK